MTPSKVNTVLQKLNLVLEYFQMLRDGSWSPETDSCESSIDNITDVINIIENG